MVYVTADIHSEKTSMVRLEESARCQYGECLSEDDVLLVCGDLFGQYDSLTPAKLWGALIAVITHTDSPPKPPLKERAADMDFLKWLSTRPYTVVSIYGNHDCQRHMKELGTRTEAFGGMAYRIADNIYYLDTGSAYDIPTGTGNTIRVLALGGACGHLARFGIDKGSWDKSKYLSRVSDVFGEHFDIVLSHEGPLSRLGIFRLLYGRNAVNEALDIISQKISFQQWFYGHHHMRKRSRNGFACLYRNIIRL